VTALRTHLAAVLAAVAIGACGKSAAEKAIDQVSDECWGLVASGKTLGDAGALLASGFPVGPTCADNLAPLQSDSCGPASAQHPICELSWIWRLNDPSACNGGCCICVVHATKASVDANQSTAPVCASEFLRGQPC